MNTAILALLVALCAVESTNGIDPRAGGNELQIMPICVADVNRIRNECRGGVSRHA